VVTIEDPGTEGSTVTLLELTHGTAARSRLEVVDLSAGSELEVNLGSVLKNTPLFAVSVSASVPILVEQQLTSRGGLTAAAGGIPVLG
jgi:hypothetical protein